MTKKNHWGINNSMQWQSMLLKFGNASEQLREAVSKLTRRLANTIVPWEDIWALKAKRLIAFDKCPGLRPIGIGNVLDRLCAKIMIDITGDDVEQECQADQLGSGIKSAIEGSIHAFSDLFEEYQTVICSGYPPLPKSGVTLAAARRENFSSDFGRRSTWQKVGILREHGEGYRGKCWNRSGPTVRDGEEICREV